MEWRGVAELLKREPDSEIMQRIQRVVGFVPIGTNSAVYKIGLLVCLSQELIRRNMFVPIIGDSDHV